jgi:hypothetical protein
VLCLYLLPQQRCPREQEIIDAPSTSPHITNKIETSVSATQHVFDLRAEMSPQCLHSLIHLDFYPVITVQVFPYFLFNTHYYY